MHKFNLYLEMQLYVGTFVSTHLLFFCKAQMSEISVTFCVVSRVIKMDSLDVALFKSKDYHDSVKRKTPCEAIFASIIYDKTTQSKIISKVLNSYIYIVLWCCSNQQMI